MNLYSPVFQVIFEAVAGSSPSGYIAVDDITIIAGACRDTCKEFTYFSPLFAPNT